MSSFPTEMRNPRIASVTEYALVATMAGAFSVTLITTLFVFFGGDLIDVGRWRPLRNA